MTVECRIMPTRTCPLSYGAEGCKPRPCARFESDDETPWRADHEAETRDHAPDELVWVAAVRRGINWHRIDGNGVGTVCGRSMRHGQSISRMRATALGGDECLLCETAAGLSEGTGPADEAADAGVSFPTGAAPAPSPVDAATGDGVTPVNDRLYDELLRPVVDRFYATAKSLAHLPVHESTRTTRAYRLGRLDALEEAGDLIADAILVAFPEWEAMREMALASTRPGTAATPPAAVPDPRTPARVAVTTSDSGCPGGHHNVPGRAT